MDITPLISADRKIIRSYGNMGFNISGQKVLGSIIIKPDTYYNVTIDDLYNLDPLTILPMLENVELLVIGTGNMPGLISDNFRKTMRDNSIITEVMSSGAACRTYNVLLAEAREVAALIIAI